MERWNPGLSQVRPVSVAKKSLRCGEQPAIVFVPADALARAESGEDLVLVMPQRSRYVKSWRKKCGIVRICQHKNVFRWQQVLVGFSVEPHISSGDLPVQPLSHRTLAGRSASCQFTRIDGTTLCHGPVKTKLVPNVGHDTGHSGGEIGYYLTRELLDSLLHVFRDGLCI